MTDKLEKEVAQKLGEAGITPSQTLLLALSGGRDSVVLGHILRALGQPFALAHVNYGLRGEDSVGDAAFVQQLAAHWEVACHLKQAGGQELTGNLQQAARQLRYAWLEDLCALHGYSFYLTAHHQSDQVESFMLALVKGRGSRSLSAMPLLKGRRLRPLLHISGAEIAAYAEHNRISWRHDRSNDALNYDRNYLRKAVLPALYERFPQSEILISRETKRLQMQEDLLSAWLEQQKGSLIEVHDAAFHRWDLSSMAQASWLEWVVGRLAADYGWAQPAIDALWQLWQSPTGKKMEAAGWTVVRTKLGFDWFVLPEKRPFSVEIKEEGLISLPDGSRLAVRQQEQASKQADFCLPVYTNSPHLVLRYWQAGDKVEIPGVGHKKVSDLLQQWKWNYRQRHLAVVLMQAEQAVWVVGGRSRTFTPEQASVKSWWVFTIEHD